MSTIRSFLLAIFIRSLRGLAVAVALWGFVCLGIIVYQARFNYFIGREHLDPFFCPYVKVIHVGLLGYGFMIGAALKSNHIPLSPLEHNVSSIFIRMALAGFVGLVLLIIVFMTRASSHYNVLRREATFAQFQAWDSGYLVKINLEHIAVAHGAVAGLITGVLLAQTCFQKKYGLLCALLALLVVMVAVWSAETRSYRVVRRDPQGNPRFSPFDGLKNLR